MDSYTLSRNFFNWSFENPEKISPNHSAIYFFAIEHCNRLGWRNKFGFPTQMAMDAIGIKKHQTYIRYFNDLVNWGFFTLIQKSQNQYSSNIISLISDLPKNGKALDKAIINHRAKQTETIGQSNSSIDKPINNITNIQINKEQLFNRFWIDYQYKIGKDKTYKIWVKLNLEEMNKCLQVISTYVKSTPEKKYRKHPATYLNGRHWEDEIELTSTPAPKKQGFQYPPLPSPPVDFTLGN
jgi:hypothetical protein